MNNENKWIVCVVILAVWIIGCLSYAVFIKSDNIIPPVEQKPQVQNVKTEVLTHEIRCVEHTSNFCVRYKVFKIIKE